MSRPRGEIRAVLESAFASTGRMSWRGAAEAAQVGYETSRRTCDNMARAGQLTRVGSLGGLTQYELAERPACAPAPVETLQHAVRSWAEFT